ncbi:unnamed protein product [Cuscuta epithymum]|uniref:Uncharacterized protein n=1 Tax=Cuscuta epithymum TaxID=186058 RepID=A0AAV0CH17_9ASTE|nr:unnamed protein product [Cuscuta epithymum]
MSESMEDLYARLSLEDEDTGVDVGEAVLEEPPYVSSLALVGRILTEKQAIRYRSNMIEISMTNLKKQIGESELASARRMEFQMNFSGVKMSSPILLQIVCLRNHLRAKKRFGESFYLRVIFPLMVFVFILVRVGVVGVF